MKRAFFEVRTSGNLNDATLAYVDEFFRGIEVKSYCPSIGVPLQPFWPSEALLPLCKTNKGVRLRSLLGNEGNMILVNAALRDIIDKVCPSVGIEYLPFVLLDHRERELSRDYFLVNPLVKIDALDRDKSDISYSKKNPKEIIDVSTFVLDRKKVDKAPELFRVAELSTKYVFGDGLLKAFKDAKATNIVAERFPFGDEL